MYATEFSYSNIVQLLVIEYQADLNAQNEVRCIKNREISHSVIDNKSYILVICRKK